MCSEYESVCVCLYLRAPAVNSVAPEKQHVSVGDLQLLASSPPPRTHASLSTPPPPPGPGTTETEEEKAEFKQIWNILFFAQFCC